MNRGEDMKEWGSIPCAYCNSTIPFVKIADVMQVKCRKCSRLQTVSIPRVIEKPIIPSVKLRSEEPEVKVKPKVVDKPKKKKKEDLYEVTTEYGMEA